MHMINHAILVMWTGGGCSSNSRRFFDPEVYHIILMDQRGAGKSRPNAELEVKKYVH